MKTRIRMTVLVSLFLAAFIAGCKDENVEIIGMCPQVVSTDPSNFALGVGLNKVIKITFNERMDPLTITPEAFTLTTNDESGRLDGTAKNSSEISGTVTYDSSTYTMSFTPNSKPKVNTTYIGRVATSVKDLMGNALQTPYIWSFRTGSTNAPVLISTDPDNAATGVPLNKIITATFDSQMDPLTLTASTFVLKQGETVITGTVSTTGATTFFTPSSSLISNTIYTVTITSDVKSLQGTRLANGYEWTFTTGIIIAPTVISTDPTNLETGVPLNKVLTATFSEPMDPSTINTSSFKVMIGTTLISGEVNYSGTTATFTPTNECLSCTNYSATITTEAKNLAGIPLANDYVWNFHTNSVSP